LILITDRKVERLYGRYMIRVLEATKKKVSLFALPASDRAKSPNTVARAYRYLLENNVDRNALICTLGGGVAGDVGGYIAATYLRGIDYAQLPTTLLAAVDSSIGGKTGINFGGKKNILGSFYQPVAIICDVALLKSLPPAEMRNGLSEVIKYALAMDEELCRSLEQKKPTDLTNGELKSIVMRCSYLKAKVVEVDETERTGERAILNFGHTVGHALETVTKFRGLGHGEAVAIGMMAAARISEEIGMLQRIEVHRIEDLLLKFGLPVNYRGVNPDELLGAVRFDKKTAFGQTGWVLLRGVGKGVVNQPVAEDIIRKVLEETSR
jgi:3-dehydroquinate synthase